MPPLRPLQKASVRPQGGNCKGDMLCINMYNIISREIWRKCFEEYDTHILCFNDFRTDQSSRAALLQICLSHVIFF